MCWEEFQSLENYNSFAEGTSPANYPSFSTGVILLGNPKPLTDKQSFHTKEAMHQVKMLLLKREKIVRPSHTPPLVCLKEIQLKKAC